MNILNIATYKFVELPAPELPALRDSLLDKSTALQLKGTILLSTEGINQCTAGTESAINDFKNFLQNIPAFNDLTYKESWSAAQPFARMIVKIKPEIIPFEADNITPEKFTAPHLAPQTLKQWYAEKRDMVVLDARNDYEIRIGKFANAMALNLQHFRHFPQVAQTVIAALKDKTVVTYCTGGIRCEKAAAWLLQAGVKDVYQLDGGILNYFEQCGGAYYEGECFVFDDRIAVDAQLTAKNVPLCKQCQSPLTVAERQTPRIVCSPCDASVNKENLA